MIDFQILCNSLATNYYFFGLGISSFLLLVSWMTVWQNLLIGISSCLSFWNPAHDSNFYWDLLLNFEILDEPPCYVQQCYRCVNLKGCLGVRCHKCKCRCTTIHNACIFGFSFLWVLARIKKESMQLYLLDIILYYNCLSLILQYHKYTYKYTLICIASCSSLYL